jgi:translation initiation factor 1
MDWKSALGALNDIDVPAAETAAEATPTAEKPKKRDKLSIFMEKKGRAGKVATIITGFSGSDEEVEEVARTLKKRIGVGGSSRGGEILLQGDWRDKATAVLRDLDFRI